MTRGRLFAAVAMTLVGSSVAVLGALRDYPVLAGQALRFAVAAAVLLVVLRVSRARGGGPAPGPVTRRQGVRLVLLAAVGMVGFNVAVVAAERRIDPALVGVVVGGAPIVIALVAPLSRRVRPHARLVLAGVVVALGAALAQGLGDGGDTVGVLLAVAALLGEVAFALVAAPMLANLGALRVSTYACAVAVPLCLAGVVPTRDVRLPETAELLALLWLGLVVTAGAYVLWFRAVADVGPERAGLFTGLIPISAVVTTAVLGTGTPTWAHVGGAVVVLCGIVLGLTGPTARRESGARDRSGDDRGDGDSHPVGGTTHRPTTALRVRRPSDTA